MSTKQSNSNKKKPTALGDLDHFFSEINVQDDFALIVVGVAKVDAFLTAVLEQFLVDSSTKDKMLEHSGPLGSFALRAQICYTLGLISKSMFSDISILANLRNETAHNPKRLTFESDEIRSKISELKWLIAFLDRNYGAIPSITDFFNQKHRYKFMMTITIMCQELKSSVKQIEKRQVFVDGLSEHYFKITDVYGNVLNPITPHLEAVRAKYTGCELAVIEKNPSQEADCGKP